MREKWLAVYKAAHEESSARIPERLARVVRPLEDGQVFGVEGATVEAIATPGHCSDHVSFLLREERSLFVGDCVLGLGSSVFSDLYLYERSLRQLRDLVPARIYCGHGPCIGPLVEGDAAWASTEARREDEAAAAGSVGGDAAGAAAGGVSKPLPGTAKIIEYLEHRKKREEQVLRAWRAAGGRASARALADAIYVPEGITGDLLLGAAGNVLHTVRKLAREGHATLLRDGDDHHHEADGGDVERIMASTIDSVWTLRPRE